MGEMPGALHDLPSVSSKHGPQGIFTPLRSPPRAEKSKITFQGQQPASVWHH